MTIEKIENGEYIFANNMGHTTIESGNKWYLVEQKPAWSEEDEMIALSIEQVMNCASLLNIVPEKIDKIRTWLKSLKERCTWKPSDEQLEALEHVINCYSGISPTSTEEVYTLEIMKEQLKKLREE